MGCCCMDAPLGGTACRYPSMSLWIASTVSAMKTPAKITSLRKWAPCDMRITPAASPPRVPAAARDIDHCRMMRAAASSRLNDGDGFSPRSGIDRVTQRQHARQSNHDNRKKSCVHRTASIHSESPLMLRSKRTVLQSTPNLTTDNVTLALPLRVCVANYLENKDYLMPQVLAAKAG